MTFGGSSAITPEQKRRQSNQIHPNIYIYMSRILFISPRVGWGGRCVWVFPDLFIINIPPMPNGHDGDHGIIDAINNAIIADS